MYPKCGLEQLQAALDFQWVQGRDGAEYPVTHPTGQHVGQISGTVGQADCNSASGDDFGAAPAGFDTGGSGPERLSRPGMGITIPVPIQCKTLMQTFCQLMQKFMAT